ncbi:MAG: 4Fe-4S binding protein [Spirochaetota bacterium]|nr:4Fe-4S binding protein [Spirochaetota bacterium]
MTISILSLIGNKIFCGWVCPVGAFQEIINLSPFFSKRKIKIAFWKSNLVRLILFAAFIPILLLMGRIIYFNPFAPVRWGISGNNWEFYSWFLLSAMLVASFFIYRPYCYFICPIGLITWLLEQISPNKIIYFREKCSNCKTCIKDSSCPTVESILQEKHILPDCHSCGKCVEVCPNDALKFGFKLPFIRKKRKKIE